MLSRNTVKTLCARGVLVGVLGFLVLVAMDVSEIQRIQSTVILQSAQAVGK